MLTVPEVRGLYYVEAQQALLAAGFCIATPTWVVNPGPDTPPGINYTPIVTANSSIGADSGVIGGQGANSGAFVQRPFYVLAQSLPAGTQLPQAPAVQVLLTVIGIPVQYQGGQVGAVP